MRFEEYCAPAQYDLADVFLPGGGNTASVLRASPIQVFYALLVLHGTRCSAAAGSCSFPACRLHKSSRCFEVPEDVGTGRHVLEVTSREYLFCRATQELRCRFIKTSRLPDDGPNPDESDEEDKRLADKNEEERIEAEVSDTKWRHLQLEAAEYRYLNRRIPRKEVEKVVPLQRHYSVLVGEHTIDEKDNISAESI